MERLICKFLGKYLGWSKVATYSVLTATLLITYFSRFFSEYAPKTTSCLNKNILKKVCGVTTSKCLFSVVSLFNRIQITVIRLR